MHSNHLLSMPAFISHLDKRIGRYFHDLCSQEGVGGNVTGVEVEEEVIH